MASAEQLATRLERATDAQLQRLAQFHRPTWRARVVRAIAMDDDENDCAPDDEKEDGDSASDGSDQGASPHADSTAPTVVELARQPIEVLDGASLADVRKLISVFCVATIPRRFVFQVIHRRRANGVDDDERDVTIEEALDSDSDSGDGVLTVLIPPVSKQGTLEARVGLGSAFHEKGERRASRASLSPDTRPPPAFSATGVQFGDLTAAVDVHIRRSDGVTLELSGFSDSRDSKLGAVPTAPLTIRLSLKMLADKVSMSEGMASILLSSAGGQAKIIKELLRRLHLFVSTSESVSDPKEIRWQWTARNNMLASDLRVNRRVRAVPVPEPELFAQLDGPKERSPAKSEAVTKPKPPALVKADVVSRSKPRAAYPSVQAGQQVRAAKEPRHLQSGAKAQESDSETVSESQALVPADGVPEQKRPETHVRMNSVEVNTSSVRSCLGIATRLVGGDIPPCFAVQMIFVELVLRDFATASLPAFVSELRPVVKDIYRSSSQPPTPENVLRSVELLWIGLFVAFWESKIQQIEAHFHKLTVGSISELRITLGKAQFEGLKASPMPPIPHRVVSILRALCVLSTGDTVDDWPLEKVISSLGMNVPAAKKRVKFFDLVQQKKISWVLFSSTVQGSFLKHIEDSELTRPIPEELDSTFSFSILRNSLVAVLNFMDFDLRKYAQRADLLSGDAVKQLQREISTVLSRAEDRSLKIATKSSKASEVIVWSAMAWIGEANLSEEQVARFTYLLQFHGADPARWYKASKDCEIFSSCPRPSRVRWYVEPRSSWCELDNEWYTFVAEADLALEFIYMEYEDDDEAVPHNVEAALVTRALTAWFGVKMVNDSTEIKSRTSTRATKIAFGVGYRFGGHPVVSVDEFPSLARLLGYQHIDSIVIGCSHTRFKGPRTVAFRCFVQETYAQQHGWSMSTYLQRLQQNNDVQRRLVRVGALPLVRLMTLREQQIREPVVSLNATVQIGDSEAHKALEVIFRSAGRYDCLVLSPAVAHTALDFIIRRRVDLKFGCDFLCNLRTFVEESSSDAVAGLMSQRYQRIMDDQTDPLPHHADVYDILWLLASRPGEFPSEWSSIAHDIVTYVFFDEEIQSDARIFQYSLMVSLEEMALMLDSTGSVVAIDSCLDEMLKGGRLQYVERVLHVAHTVYQLIVSQSLRERGNLSKLEVAVNLMSLTDAIHVLEGLLARYFAVARTELGLSRLGVNESVVAVLLYILDQTHFSSLMAMIATEYIGAVGRRCKIDDSVQQKVVGMHVVARMVEVAWTSKHEVTTVALLRALAVFSKSNMLRREAVYTLARLFQTCIRAPGTSLVRNFLPSVVDEDIGRCMERIRVFNHLSVTQHQASSACLCTSVDAPIASMARQDVRALTREKAEEMVDRIIDQVASRIAGVADGSLRPHVSAGTRFRKASQIQRTVLKWLYNSRRLRKVSVRAPMKARCANCAACPSFIGEVINFINAIDFASFDRSPGTAQDVFAILGCINGLVQCSQLSVVLASHFSLHHALLSLSSHRSQAVRGLALSSLAELCWHSTDAFQFTNARLSKSLWRNLSTVLQNDQPLYCSWIEHAVHFAIGTLESVSNATTHASNDNVTNEQVAERDAVASMVAVLSFSGDNSDIILRVGRLLTKTITQWICEYTPYAHVNLLVAIQNAITRTPSLGDMAELALHVFEDLASLRFTTCANDTITMTLVVGIMWICCTCERVRKQAVIKAPDSMTDSSVGPDRLMLATLLNEVGLLATVSVDCPVVAVSETVVNQLHRSYLALGNTVSCTARATAASDPGSSPRTRIEIFSPPKSTWVTRLKAFGLLPEIGTLACVVSWDHLAERAMDQIFRWFCVVAAGRMFDDSITNLALSCYVKSFGHQVERGGVSAQFALETLPDVFRSATAFPGVERQREKTSASDDTLRKARKVVLSGDQAASLVSVLGGTIERSYHGTTAHSDVHESERTGILRRVVLALWGLQVMSSRAQSLSLSITPRLVELLHNAQADNELRIAILGLLVKMYRAHPTPRTDVEAAAPRTNDQTQSRVLRVVMGEFPLIMSVLRTFAVGRDMSAMVIETDAWSPLTLDKLAGSSSSSARRLEIVTQIRWPVEVLSLLCGSIFFEQIEVRREYYDILINLLLQLDSPLTRKVYVQGRDEVVLGVSAILRAFCTRVHLTTTQTELCVKALFDSEPLMTYASDLAAVCHASIQALGSIDSLVQRQQTNLLPASLRFIGSGDLRLDLLSNCLDMMFTIAAAMGEHAYMDQIRVLESDPAALGSSVAALFGQTMRIFQGPKRSVSDWTICRKALGFFRKLVMWDSFYNRFVCGQDQQPHRLKAKSIVSDLSGSSRPRSYHLDETTRSIIHMTLQLVDFKYWCDEVPSASHGEVLLASADANAILVRLLRDFGEDSRETATLLIHVGEAFSPAYPNRVFTDDTVKDPLERLVSVVAKTYFSARECARNAFHSRDLYEEIFGATLNELVLLTALHRARHTVHISQFFIRHYAYPVFSEANSAYLAKLVRLYRQCCCNAYVYRIIRLGKKSLWTEPRENEDLSFFRKLGEAYRRISGNSAIPEREQIRLRIDLALFLVQQDFSFVFASDMAPRDNDAEPARHQNQEEMIQNPADEATAQVCLREQFFTSPRRGTITYAAQEFEAGLLSMDVSEELCPVQGVALYNELIEVLAELVKLRSTSGPPIEKNSEDVLSLLKVLLRLLDALQSCGEHMISNASWTRILFILEAAFLTQIELEAMFDLLRTPARSEPNILTSRTHDVVRALTARLGLKGVVAFGNESCHSTLGFFYAWISAASNEVTSRVLTAPHWVASIFEIMTLFRLGGPSCILGEYAFSCFVIAAQSASEADRRAVLDIMTTWQPADRPTSLTKNVKLMLVACGTAWEVLLQFLYEPHSASLRRTCLNVVRGLAVAQPEEVGSELVRHNAMPLLLALLYDSDRDIANSALWVLHFVCSAAHLATAAVGYLLQCGVKKPYFTGPLVPLRGEPSASDNEALAGGSRDRVKIADLLMRQPICVGMNPSEILHLASTVSTARFQPGEDMTLVTPGSSRSSLLVIASGSVEWRVAVSQRNSRPVFIESARLEKGALVGASSVLDVRKPNRFSVIETATAVNSVVCLVVNDLVDVSSPLCLKARAATARACGLWHRWLCLREDEVPGPRSHSYVKHLVDLASGDLGADETVQTQASDLLRITCLSAESLSLDLNDKDRCTMWALVLVPLLQRPVVLRSLRLEIYRQLVHLTTETPRNRIREETIISLGRDSSRMDGLVVLGRAFRVISTDSECLALWLRAVAILIPLAEYDSEAMRRTKVLVGAMSDGSILRLAAICISPERVFSGESVSVAQQRVWSVLLLVCRTKNRLGRLADALRSVERSELMHKVVTCIVDHGGLGESTPFAVLAALTAEPKLCASLWSPRLDNDVTGHAPMLLQLFLTSPVSDPDCNIAQIMDVLLVFVNSLKTTAISTDAKQEIIVGLHRVHIQWFANLAGFCSTTSAQSQSRNQAVSLVVTLICVLAWARKSLKNASVRELAGEMLHVFAGPDWLCCILQETRISFTAKLCSRAWSRSSLSALRVLYEWPNQLSIDAEDAALTVGVLLDARNRSNRSFPNYDPTIEAALHYCTMLSCDGEYYLPASLSQEFHSVVAFVEANGAAMNEMSRNRRSFRKLTQRFRLLRVACSMWRSEVLTDPDMKRTDVALWLLDCIRHTSMTAAIHRASAGCLLRLFQRDGSFRELVTTWMTDTVLGHLFGALEVSERARTAKLKLLYYVCVSMPVTKEGSAEHALLRPYVSAWMATIVKVALEREWDFEMTGMLVSISGWLLAGYANWCHSLISNTITTQAFIQRKLDSVLRRMNGVRSCSSQRTVEVVNETVFVVYKIFTIKTACFQDMCVFESFLRALLMCTSELTQSTDTAVEWSEQEHSLIFNCLSTINQLLDDECYSFKTRSVLRSDAMRLLLACKPLLDRLSQFDRTRRSIVFTSAQWATAVLDATHKPSAQQLLYSAWQQTHGWMNAMSSLDAVEQNQATTLAHEMCAKDDKLTALCIGMSESLLMLLQANLHRCKDAITQCDVHLRDALVLLHKTLALLYHVIYVLATTRSSIRSVLFDDIVSTAAALQLVRLHPEAGDVSISAARIEAEVLSCLVLQACFKYHIGTCRKIMVVRQRDVLATILQILGSLLRHLDAFKKSIGVVRWISRAIHVPLPSDTAESSSAVREAYSDLFIGLMSLLDEAIPGPPFEDSNFNKRGSVRLLQSAHALMTLAPLAVGASVVILLQQRGLSQASLRLLIGLHKRFASLLPSEVLCDLVFLGAKLNDDDTLPLELLSSVRKVIEVAASSSATNDEVNTAKLCRLIVVGNRISEAMLKRTGTGLYEGREHVPTILRSTLTCLARSAALRLHHSFDSVALSAARLMTALHIRKAVVLDHDTAADIFHRTFEMLEVQPKWELAWMATSALKCIQATHREDSLLAGLGSNIYKMRSRLVDGAASAIAKKNIRGCFHLLGLVAELLREQCRVNEPSTRSPALQVLVIKALRVRSKCEDLSTLALVCWLFERQASGYPSPLELAIVDGVGDTADSTNLEENSTETADGSVSRYVSTIAELIHDQVNAMCNAATAVRAKPSSCIESSSDSHGPTWASSFSSHDFSVGADLPALTLLDDAPQTRRFICTWTSLRVIDYLVSDAHESTVARQFAKSTNVISDTARLLSFADVLPDALVLVTLHVLANSMKAFRLFATSIVDRVSTTDLSRLVRSRDPGVSIQAMRTLWQTLRNRKLCHHFVAIGQASQGEAEKDHAINEAIQHCKELVYMGVLDEGRLEAAYGILVQLTKCQEALDFTIFMDELHPNAIFFDDPHSLLSAVSPLPFEAVLLQQCKLLKHVARYRPGTILLKPACLNCLGDAIKWVEPRADQLPLALATGETLLCLVEATKTQPDSSGEYLRELFTADGCAVLHGCYRNLQAVLGLLKTSDRSCKSVRVVHTLTLYSSLFFCLTSTKRSLCLRTQIIEGLTSLPKTLLIAIGYLRSGNSVILTGATRHEGEPQAKQLELRLLRTLRRITVASATSLQFRSHDPSSLNEPFDLLVGLLPSASCVPDELSVALDRELMLILLHVTRDPTVSTIITTRHDALSSLLRYQRQLAPTAILALLWQVLSNIVEHSAHIAEVMMRLASEEHVSILAQEDRWLKPESQRLARAITSTLRVIVDKSAGTVYALILKYTVVFDALLRHSPMTSSGDPAILESLATILAGAMPSCSRDFVVFCDVLALIERVVVMVETETVASHDGATVIPEATANGLRLSLERLVCALCDLLLSFHEDETNNSLYPGYEIKLTRANADFSASQSEEPISSRLSLRVRSKKTGLYCKGYSPLSSDVLDRIIRIFSAACSPRMQHRTQRRIKRRGRSVGGDVASLGGNCIVVVSDFFYQVAKTPSGRFVALNPTVIHLWFQLLPRMDTYSLQKLCDGLVLCTMSKHQTSGFLFSSGLKLLISTTCKIVKDVCARVRRQSPLSPRRLCQASIQGTREGVAISDAFLQFTTAAAVMTERAAFLQSTFYLVHAGADRHITVAGLVLAAIVFASGCSSYRKLACKVLCRILSVFTLEETKAFLAACPEQMARALAWDDISEEDVLMALITMVEETESEAIMKQRVLVKIIHSTLLRTAVLGLIEKGIPEVLHDFGLKNMIDTMKTLKEACHDVQVAHTIMIQAQMEAAKSAGSTSRRRNSLSGTKTSVEKLTAGLTAVSEAARTAGVALLATPFQDDDGSEDTDPQTRFTRRLERCTDTFKDLETLVATYAVTGYRDVFKKFEASNELLELIAAMQSSSDAVALTQATFYAIELIQEALVAALSDAEADTTSSSRDASGDQAAEASQEPRLVASVGEKNAAAIADTNSFLQKLDCVLELIIVSLQHSDMDILFYGHKLQQLGRLVETLFQLPITDEEHDTGLYSATDVEKGVSGGNERSPTHDTSTKMHQRRPSITTLRRNRTSDNFPVYLRFKTVQLRSWLWSILGFLPYLRVRHDDDVQLIRFTRCKPAAGSDFHQASGDPHGYVCHFDVERAHQHHVETSFRELPRTVDVEVWVYLPFWYQDVLVSHAKVPLLARSMETEAFDFQFYPEGSRGAQAYRPDVVATLTMTLSDRQGDTKGFVAAESENNSFPAYSTLGSRRLRQFLRFLARVTFFTKLSDAVSAARRRRKLLAAATLNGQLDSLGNDRQLDAMTAHDVVAYLITKAVGILREVTHPDKLVAPAAAAECEPLVAQLEKMAPGFARTLADAFETRNTRVWRDAEKALGVVRQLFLEKGLTFFSAHFQHQTGWSSQVQPRVGADATAVHPSSPSQKRKSKREKRPSSFVGAWTSHSLAPKKTLQDVSSQLRCIHLHEKQSAEAGETDRQQATLSGRLLSHTAGIAMPSTKMLAAMSKRSAKLSDGRGTNVSDGRGAHGYANSPFATLLFHQQTASKSEWRMVYPHVSLWNLSQTREPQWHSFERMTAPTSLNHFLLQPIQRLQVYCAVLEYVQPKMQRLREKSTDVDVIPTLAKHNHLQPSRSMPVLKPQTGKVELPHPAAAGALRGHDEVVASYDAGTAMGPLSVLTAKESAGREPSGSLSSRAPAGITRSLSGIKTLWRNVFNLSSRVNSLAMAPQTGAPEIRDFQQLEAVRARRLLKYHTMDPFDAAARLQRLHQHASRLPARLYQEGFFASAVHIAVWFVLTVTVWRVSIARDAVRDSERSFQELHASQSTGELDYVSQVLNSQPFGENNENPVDRKRRIVISDRQPRHQQPALAAQPKRGTTPRPVRRHQVAPSSTTSDAEVFGMTLSADMLAETSPHFIVLSEQELKHLVILLELKRLVADVFHVWPSENGNIGLSGFWSSLKFTAIALGCPPLLVYAVFPAVLRIDRASVRFLSYVACFYGACWIVAAFFSIRGVTKKIPAFREVRHVERINLTDFPYSLRNYMAIASVVWDGFQLNTTSFSVWKMSYKPKQLAALTTIDLQDIGLGSLEVNIFASKQTLALACLLLWIFCLKASNKFKSIQLLNYLLTFLLPNLLGGMLFMFLSQQFYQTAACFQDPLQNNATVMWSNSDIPCWTSVAHQSYALRGMFGMSLFVPLAVLAYGSYQVFFPEVNLDVQTSPMLNVSAQIVKAAMMGALTFFMNQVELFLAVALVGNALLLFLVTKYDVCSTWHLKYGKVLIYAMSSWSALCAMISTAVDEEQRERLPLHTMHSGWGVLVVLCMVFVRRRLKKQQQLLEKEALGQRVLIKPPKQKTSIWTTKPKAPLTVAPSKGPVSPSRPEDQQVEPAAL